MTLNIVMQITQIYPLMEISDRVLVDFGDGCPIGSGMTRRDGWSGRVLYAGMMLVMALFLLFVVYLSD